MKRRPAFAPDGKPQRNQRKYRMPKPPKKRKAPAFFIKNTEGFFVLLFYSVISKKNTNCQIFLCFFPGKRLLFSSEKSTETLIFPFPRGKISYVNLKKTAISRFLLHNRNYVVFLCAFTPPVPDILFFSGVPCLC